MKIIKHLPPICSPGLGGTGNSVGSDVNYGGGGGGGLLVNGEGPFEGSYYDGEGYGAGGGATSNADAKPGVIIFEILDVV